MKSIFDLKTKNSELESSNQGLTNYKYSEVQSLKSAVGNNFADGQLVYRWTYGSNKYWIPNKSYMRIRCKLTDKDGNKLTSTGDMALSMNTAPQLFQSAQYKIADQMVSQITENLAQVDTLKNRMNKSGAWLNTVGSSNNFFQSTFKDRLNELSPVSGDINMCNIANNHITHKELYTRMSAVPINLVSNVDTVRLVDDFTVLNSQTADLVFGDVDAGGSLLQFRAGTDGLGAIQIPVDVGDTIIYTVVENNKPVDYAGKVIAILSAKPADGNDNINNIIRMKTTKATGNVAPTNVEVSTLNIRVVKNADSFGKNARSLETFELFWYPPLSVFDVKHAIPCSGTKNEFTLTPYPNQVYQKNIIESIIGDKNVSDDFNFEIVDMRFYILTCDSNSIQDNFEFMLDLNEVHCQSSIITNPAQQTNIDVVGSCDGITLAFQDEAVYNNTLYPISKFNIRENLEMNLQRYYIRYEGQVPQPDGEFNYDGLTIDTLGDVYNRSKIYDGSFFKDSVETIQEFRERGIYIYHPFPKTSSSRNTRVYTQTNFSGLTDSDGNVLKPRLLLFQHYKKVVILNVQNGKIVAVSPIDA